MGDGEQDLDCGDGDGDGDADRDGFLSGELERLILSGDAKQLSIRERLLGATFALRGTDSQPRRADNRGGGYERFAMRPSTKNSRTERNTGPLTNPIYSK